MKVISRMCGIILLALLLNGEAVFAQDTIRLKFKIKGTDTTLESDIQEINISIEILPANKAPEFKLVDSFTEIDTVKFNEKLIIDLSKWVNDPDGENSLMTFENGEGNPSGVSIDGTNLVWNTAENIRGRKSFNIIAKDGKGKPAQGQVYTFVKFKPEKPATYVIDGYTEGQIKSVEAGSTLEFSITFSGIPDDDKALLDAIRDGLPGYVKIEKDENNPLKFNVTITPTESDLP